VTEPALLDADDPRLPADAVEVGRVLGAWGIKGWIRVAPHARDPQALFSSRRWYVVPDDPSRPAATLPGLLRITHSRSQGDTVVAAAQELPDRAAAEAMRGARIFVPRSSFPTAADGEYYWVDLIGLAVVNRQGEALGTVIDLIDTGVHSVLRLRRPDATDTTAAAEAERLIPFVGAYVDAVDLAGRRIVVDWGLDY
jgi:16S rRNA processing protein RimM